MYFRVLFSQNIHYLYSDFIGRTEIHFDFSVIQFNRMATIMIIIIYAIMMKMTFLSSLLLVYENSSIFCTSKTTLLAAFLATLIFQTSLIAFCCSCLFFWRVRRSKPSIDKRLTNYGPYKGPYSSAWSSFNAIE